MGSLPELFGATFKLGCESGKCQSIELFPEVGLGGGTEEAAEDLLSPWEL